MSTKKNPTESIRHILSEDSSFNTIETYKSIRTNIMFSLPKADNGKVIAVTSAIPGDGKTTTAINLAITFAELGVKVALLDCDLRKSRVHRYLQIERGVGITNVLCGFCSFEEAIKRDIRPNLDVLTAGEIPPNPAELFETAEFDKLIDKLKDEYDYILVDTPPVKVVTDAVIISKNVSGVVLTVRENQTTYEMLETSLNSLNTVGVKILGVIVRDCDATRKKYGYSKGSYYRKGYKYGYGKRGCNEYNYSDDTDEDAEGDNLND